MKKLPPFIHIILTVILTFPLLLSSCNSDSEEEASSSEIASIDLVEAYSNRKEVPLSIFAKSVEYIRLETLKESLIARAPYFQITDEKIIVSAHQQVLAFEKSSGHFIKKLGTKGEGPGEYRQADKYFDESTGYTYVNSLRGKHMGLNADGEIKKTFNAPSSDSTFVTSFTHINDSTFVGFHGNYNCNQKYKLIFFNEKGEEIKLISNNETCLNEDPNSIHFLGREGVFATFRHQTFFKETFNDTLFQIVNMGLQPRAVFNLGNNGIPYQERLMHTSTDSKLDFFEPQMIDINRAYIFFQLTTKAQTFSGVFKRDTGETFLSDIGSIETHGFINDLDNFLPFVPQYLTNKNQLVGYVEAPDILNWFKENPDKAAQLPANLKKLGEIRNDDNPLVMIVNLKD